jgi:ATP-dependent Clp protease ATP-binding subunit ClpX
MLQLHRQVESGDLVRYGLIPEFTGRLPILVSLAALNEDQLVQVALENVAFLLLLYSMLLMF